MGNMNMGEQVDECLVERNRASEGDRTFIIQEDRKGDSEHLGKAIFKPTT